MELSFLNFPVIFLQLILCLFNDLGQYYIAFISRCCGLFDHKIDKCETLRFALLVNPGLMWFIASSKHVPCDL